MQKRTGELEWIFLRQNSSFCGLKVTTGSERDRNRFLQARCHTPICISLSARSIWIPNELLRESELVVTESQNLYLRIAALLRRFTRWNFPSDLNFARSCFWWKKYEIWWNKSKDINMFWIVTLGKQAGRFFLTAPWPALNKHEISLTYSWRPTLYMVQIFAWATR